MPRSGSLDTGTATSDPAHETVAGRFAILSRLGEGGAGQVELVRDRFDGDLYALKRVPLDDRQRCSMLLKEFRLRRELAHPQIPAAHELGRDPEAKIAWLVMDYASGHDLGGAILEWGSEAAAVLLAQALNAVDFLHGRGVLHGDLKPDNIRVSSREEGRRPFLRLLDFGLARGATEAPREPLGGTPQYMAPSLLEGRPATPATDLYALGLAFEEALIRSGEEDAARIEPRARAVLDKLTREDPDLAYASAAEALSELSEIRGCRPADLPRPTEPVFCGREEEWKALSLRLGALAAGHLQEGLLLLTGPGGIGKSRLLGDLGHEAILRGVEVLRLRCHRTPGALEIPLALAHRLLPASSPVRRDLAGLAGQRPAGGSGAAQRVLRDLARELNEHSQASPVLILVDDLEEADEPTAQFLSILGRMISPSGPLLVGAVATDAEGGGGPLLGAGAGEQVELQLDPLPEDACLELMESMAPGRDREEAEWRELAVLSRGNPRLASLLALEVSPGEPPEGEIEGRFLRRLLAGRSRLLGHLERDLLRDLAVLQRAAPLHLLAAIRDEKPAPVRAALRTLEAEGLIEREVWQDGGRYRLAARALRAAVLADVQASDLAGRHARALAAWEAWPRPEDRPAEMLVEHAIGAGDRRRALGLGLPTVAPLQEPGSLHVAASLAGGLRRLVPSSEVELAAQLESGLAEALLRSGRPAEAREIAEEGLRSIESVEALDPALRVRMLSILGAVAEAEGDLTRSLEILRQASRVAGRRLPKIELLCLMERLGTVHFRLGAFDDARSAWERGLELGGEAADLGPAANLWNNLGVLDTQEGRLEDAVQRHERALNIRRSHGDLEGESRSLNNLGILALKSGDFDRAISMYEQCRRLMRQVGSLQAQAVALGNLSELSRARGEYGRAMGYLKESLELRVRSGDRIGEARMRGNLAGLLTEKGDLDRAEEELVACRELLERTGAIEGQGAALAFAEGELAWELGDLERAADCAEAGLQQARGSAGRHERSQLLRLRGRIRVARREFDSGLADLEEALQALGDPGDPQEVAWCQLHLGRTLLELGQNGRARDSLERAEGSARRLGAMRLLAETLLERARLELGRGRVDRAATCLAEAEPIADRLGVPATRLLAFRGKGIHALAGGQIARAAMWWRRAVELLQESVARLEKRERQETYLSLPERREAIASLEDLLGGGKIAPPKPGRGGADDT